MFNLRYFLKRFFPGRYFPPIGVRPTIADAYLEDFFLVPAVGRFFSVDAVGRSITVAAVGRWIVVAR